MCVYPIICRHAVKQNLGYWKNKTKQNSAFSVEVIVKQTDGVSKIRVVSTGQEEQWMLGELRRGLTLKTPHWRKTLQHWLSRRGRAHASGSDEQEEEQCDLRQVCPGMETYRSRAPLVGMLRAKPRTPVCWKYGMLKMLAAMTATES